MPPATTPQGDGLARKLSGLDAASIVVGIVIGSGIFLVPSSLARSLPSAGLMLVAWIAGGIVTFFGALAYAELGAMRPSTGGQYIYLREAWGPLAAFLSGWTLFLVIWSGGIAALAVAFATYLAQLWPLTPAARNMVAIALIAALSGLNALGVREGAVAQNFVNALKIAGLAILTGGAFLAVGPEAMDWSLGREGVSASRFGTAMIGILFAYEGWNAASFVAGEVRDPERNLPRALALGTAFCAAVFSLVTLAYLRVLPIATIAASERVGAAAAERVLGPAGATLATLTILVAVAGSANGSILTGPRMYFAQARDGLFFRGFGRVHPRLRTPATAILAQAVWSAVLVLSGTFDRLLTYAMVAAWTFYGLTVAGVIVLRRREPERPRPYRMWGYPATPVIFCALAAALVVNALFTETAASLISLGIVASGAPFYYWWRRRG
ncbi:MAG: APC family permease [Bryobacteraceae bacterium]